MLTIVVEFVPTNRRIVMSAAFVPSMLPMSSRVTRSTVLDVDPHDTISVAFVPVAVATGPHATRR